MLHFKEACRHALLDELPRKLLFTGASSAGPGGIRKAGCTRLRSTRETNPGPSATFCFSRWRARFLREHAAYLR